MKINMYAVALICLCSMLVLGSVPNSPGLKYLEKEQNTDTKLFGEDNIKQRDNDLQAKTSNEQKILSENNQIEDSVISNRNMNQQINLHDDMQHEKNLQVRRVLNQISNQETDIQYSINQQSGAKTSLQSQNQSIIIAQQSNELSRIACGNGRIQRNQQCDDGNQREGDGCNSMCENQKGLSTALIIVIAVIPSVLLILGIVLIVRYCCNNREAVSEIKTNNNQVASEQALPEVTNKQSIVLP